MNIVTIYKITKKIAFPYFFFHKMSAAVRIINKFIQLKLEVSDLQISFLYLWYKYGDQTYLFYDSSCFWRHALLS